MPSWVRYSVSVYLGLLLAGSLVPAPNASIGSQPERVPSVERAPLPSWDEQRARPVDAGNEDEPSRERSAM